MDSVEHILIQNQELLQLKRLVVPIVATSTALDLFEPIGSAFVIYAGGKKALALTAAHNIQRVAKIERPHDRCHPTTLPEFRIHEPHVVFEYARMRVLYPALDGQLYMPHLTHAHVIEAADIAVCVLEISGDLPEDLLFDRKFAIDSRTPEKSSHMVAIGYKEMSVPSLKIEGKQALVRYSETLVRRPGIISEVYPIHGPRNQPMPCFQCSTPFDNGMSGGPIVDFSENRATAIGVISSDLSFEFPHRGSGESALASILWPAMGCELKHVTLENIEAPTLLDFQSHRMVEDRGQALQHIQFSEDRAYFRWVDTPN